VPKLDDGTTRSIHPWPFRIGRDVTTSYYTVASTSVSPDHAFLTLPQQAEGHELKSSRPPGAGAEGADRSTSGADRSTTEAAVLVFITDTGLCGTFVNGVRIESTCRQVALSCGDRVAFTEHSAAQSCHSEHMDEAFVIQEESPTTWDTDGTTTQKRQTRDTAAELSRQTRDALAELATGTSAKLCECSICLGVQYRAVAALPCLHNFCSTCAHRHCTESASATKRQCPVCKQDVMRWQPNHAQRQHVQLFCDMNPKHRRTEEEDLDRDDAPQIPVGGLNVESAAAAATAVRHTTTSQRRRRRRRRLTRGRHTTTTCYNYT